MQRKLGLVPKSVMSAETRARLNVYVYPVTQLHGLRRITRGVHACVQEAFW